MATEWYYKMQNILPIFFLVSLIGCGGSNSELTKAEKVKETPVVEVAKSEPAMTAEVSPKSEEEELKPDVVVESPVKKEIPPEKPKAEKQPEPSALSKTPPKRLPATTSPETSAKPKETTPSESTSQSNLQSRPSTIAVTKAGIQVKKLYKDDYKKRDRTAKLELAKNLLELAIESKDKPAEQFFTFQEAAKLASEAGDVTMSLAVVDQLSSTFDIGNEGFLIKSDILKVVAKSTHTPEASKELLKICFTLINDSVDADDYESATRFASTANFLAKKTKDDDLRKETIQRSKEIKELQQAYKKVERVLSAVTEPDDPTANLEVGKFYCLLKGDWEKGLPMLVKSSDFTLKHLAELDILNPTEPKAQIKLGESWQEFGKKQKGALVRAAHWYEIALPKLTGVEKAQIEQRLGKIEKMIGPASVYLSDMVPLSLDTLGSKGRKTGELAFQVLRPDSAKSQWLIVLGHKAKHGFMLHPPKSNSSAYLSYNIKKVYRKFVGSTGLTDKNTGGSASPLVFRVVGDGKTLWISKPVQKPGIVQAFNLNVSGIKKLELFVDCPGSYVVAGAIWIDPQLKK